MQKKYFFRFLEDSGPHALGKQAACLSAAGCDGASGLEGGQKNRSIETASSRAVITVRC